MNRELETIITAHTIKGTSFVGVRNYTNTSGELSNQTILVGAEYAKAKLMDVETAREFDITSYESDFPVTLLADAKNKIIESLLNPGKSQSEGQKAAYTHVGPGLKVHNEKQELYVYGFVIAKTVHVKGGVKIACGQLRRR